MTDDTTHIGYARSGWSYVKSGAFLDEAQRADSLSINPDMPIYYLFAHGLELTLKGLLLRHSPGSDVQRYGHKLLNLYDDLRHSDETRPVILGAETTVRNRFRNYLRTLRDRYEAKIGLDAPDEETRRELGSFSNQQIGDTLPELRRQVEWLDRRHRDDGGQFRYLKTGPDQRPEIHAFGKKINVVGLMTCWACAELHKSITGREPRY